jgi:hypothetical protein
MCRRVGISGLHAGEEVNAALNSNPSVRLYLEYWPTGLHLAGQDAEKLY